MEHKRVTASRLTPWLAHGVAAGWLLFAPVLLAADADILSRGKEIAFDPTKGNCLACHQIEDGESPGDLGPPLVAIEARYPDKQVLRKHLWDPMEFNPGTRMPPFGRHRILSEGELDLLVEYIYTL